MNSAATGSQYCAVAQVTLCWFEIEVPPSEREPRNIERKEAFFDPSQYPAVSEEGGRVRLEMVNFRAPQVVINGFVADNISRVATHHTGLYPLLRYVPVWWAGPTRQVYFRTKKLRRCGQKANAVRADGGGFGLRGRFIF